MKEPKIAIFYDWLNQWGGAEKVLLSLIELYPDAPIFTLVYDPKKTSWLPKGVKVNASFLNKLPLAKKNPIFYTPFYSLAIEQFNTTQFDIIISTTSTVGHSFISSPQTLFVCYFHNINRYLYHTPPEYKFLLPLLKLYQHVDKIYSQRPDEIFCNSQTVADRIKKFYHRPAKIIYPGVDTTFFKPTTTSLNSQPYFLMVSRLVPHKNIDTVINAFKDLSYELKIVGTGRDANRLKQLSRGFENIHLIGSISQTRLLDLYQHCSALICPQLEDFGLTPIEAQACGKPVIALGHGGYTETIINGQTGVFFDKPTTSELHQAINIFFKTTFSTQACRDQAIKFSQEAFMLNFKQSLESLWQRHQITTF